MRTLWDIISGRGFIHVRKKKCLTCAFIVRKWQLLVTENGEVKNERSRRIVQSKTICF